jgi:hypothetical protein
VISVIPVKIFGFSTSSALSSGSAAPSSAADVLLEIEGRVCEKYVDVDFFFLLTTGLPRALAASLPPGELGVVGAGGGVAGGIKEAKRAGGRSASAPHFVIMPVAAIATAKLECNIIHMASMCWHTNKATPNTANV